MTKKKIIIIISVVLIIIMVLGIFLIRRSPQQPTTLQPTPTPGMSTRVNVTPAIAYDKQSSSRMADIIVLRPTLSPPDQQIKGVLTNESNPLYVTRYITIKYYPVSDLFETEINTVRINTAKKEAAAWFLRQGLTNNGICKLPLIFYLNESSAKTLNDFDVVFNPLPLGC